MSHSKNRSQKLISGQMIAFELRNVTGNPFVHIFGIGFPILMGLLIPRAVTAGIKDVEAARQVTTSMFIGMGMLIPMATILMGYAISYAQELEKGIPQRMELFGIKNSVSLCNRAVSEGIFMLFAFLLYFLAGAFLSDIEKPTVSGVLIYAACMVALTVIFFALGHAIACLLPKFGPTYCVSMLLFFGIMILSGMMGLTYEALPKAGQMLAKLLPVMYINRDFYMVWQGDSYNFMPIIQAFLFFGAASFLTLLVALRFSKRK